MSGFTNIKKYKDSRYTGVHYNVDINAWYAILSSQYRKYYSSNYQTESEAAEAYDMLLMEHRRTSSLYNFEKNKPITKTMRKDIKPPSRKRKSNTQLKNKQNHKKTTIKHNNRIKFPQWMRNKVCSTQEWNCNLCCNRFSDAMIIDHIIPLYLDGSNNINNLQGLCPSCDKFKTHYLDNQVIKPAIFADKNISSSEIIQIQKMKYNNILLSNKYGDDSKDMPIDNDNNPPPVIGKRNITISAWGITLSITT